MPPCLVLGEGIPGAEAGCIDTGQIIKSLRPFQGGWIFLWKAQGGFEGLNAEEWALSGLWFGKSALVVGWRVHYGGLDQGPTSSEMLCGNQGEKEVVALEAMTWPRSQSIPRLSLCN